MSGVAESREALMSRGSTVASKAESTTVAVVRRTEQSLARLARYEHDVGGLAVQDVFAAQIV